MSEAATDLFSELLADSSPRVQGCVVCQWLEGRDDADSWDQAFQNPAITGTAIRRAMARRGFAYKDKPIQNHRNEQHRVG